MRITKKQFIEKLNGKCVFFCDRYLTAKIERNAIVLYDGAKMGQYVHILQSKPSQNYRQKYYHENGAFFIDCYYKNKPVHRVSFYT